MLPTVAPKEDERALYSREFADVSQLAERFDAALFTGPMILIDQTNHGMKLVATADHAKAAVVAGYASTWAAQVRPGVVAIDVDLDHKGLASEISDDLSGWARSRGLWCAVRASGGGRGRRHIIVAAGTFDELLHARVHDWREQAGLSATQLDLRGAIRPFSAPHRTTERIHLPATLDVADLDRIHDVVQASKPVVRPRRRRATTKPRIIGHQDVASLPEVAPSDLSRSGVEFAQTLALYNAGASETAAWSCISSQPGTKSEERGHRWWQVNIWDRIRPRPAKASADPAVATINIAETILPTIKGHQEQLDALHPRTRNTCTAVLMVLLEKLHTSRGKQWVPVSERDLHLCTGLGRTTIRQATAYLVGLGIVARREAITVSEAHSYQKGPSCITSLTAPPLLTPRPTRWLPHCPPSAAHELATHHLHPHRPESTRQRHLQATTLTALRSRGVMGTTHDPGTALEDAARWDKRLRAVTAERDAFHGACRIAHRLAQGARVMRDELRRRRWWDSLSTDERRERTQHWRAAFQSLPHRERDARCDELARRRDHARLATQAPLPTAA